MSIFEEYEAFNSFEKNLLNLNLWFWRFNSDKMKPLLIQSYAQITSAVQNAR